MDKSEKILIFSLILILFMSISTISATDNNQDDALHINSNDGNLNDVIDNTVDKKTPVTNTKNPSTDKKTIISATSDYDDISFTDLKTQISRSSSVNLYSNVVYTSGDDARGIMITKDVTINGNGYTMDAKNKARMFRVASGCTLTLTNLNFINGFRSNENGGAILNGGTVKSTNCNFTNCKVSGSQSSGGAIGGGGSGTFSNCNFNKCSATYFGGAAYVDKIKFNNCNFKDNNAKFGGAIGGKVYLYNSNFENCKATQYKSDKSKTDGGGACSGEILRAEGCTFTNCKATTGYGGALRGAAKAIYNCKFIGCTAAKEGGAVRGVCNAIGCTFINCVAIKGMGGAIYTQKSTIDKCEFIECSATNSYGGAIYLGNNAKINNCKFTKCSAPNGCGGAVYGASVITKCTFENNRAKFGGAVHGYSLIIKRSTFTGNSASKGGAAYQIKSLTSCKLTKNKATYGGAVYDAQKVTSSKFVDNYAKRGAVSYNDVTVVFKKANIKNTLKLVQGLFYNHKHKLTLTKSKIINSGKFSKYLNYNTGTFIYTKNKLQSTYKVKKIVGPRKEKK